MAISDAATLKTYFETGDVPTQAQFADFIDTAVRDSVVAIATAMEGGKTGLVEVTGASGVTARPVGELGKYLIGATTTAAVQGYIGAGTVGIALLESSTTASALGFIGASAAAISVVDSISGTIQNPTNRAYVLDQSAARGYKVSWIAIKTSAGDCIADLQINSESISGLATVTASSTETITSATGTTVMSVGDTLRMVLTSATATDALFFTIGILKQ